MNAMIANLTRGAKTASLHLPTDRFQIAGVLSYLGVDRLDDYELPCEGQDSSGIMVSLETFFNLSHNSVSNAVDILVLFFSLYLSSFI